MFIVGFMFTFMLVMIIITAYMCLYGLVENIQFYLKNNGEIKDRDEVKLNLLGLATVILASLFLYIIW